MRIRLAHARDATGIASLHARSWRVAYRGMLSDAYLDGPVEAERAQLWHNRFAQPAPNQYVVVAEAAEQIVGFACAYGAEDPTWGTLLENLHVAQEHKRRGIGAGLVAQVASWSAQTHPEASLHLWVLKPNLPAQNFYQVLGAEHIESAVWHPPEGGPVPQIRLVWRQPQSLLARVTDKSIQDVQP